MGQDQDVLRFRFGSFELQPGERRLMADGRPVAVGARAFNLLVALVERSGQLVSKDELLDRVWPNLVVEENNLQVQVSALRKILGAEAIVTVPGHGYRFTLEPSRDLPMAAAATCNLPRQTSSFVGRTKELHEIRALLDKARLLTLVGFGGMGKTRLALRVAAGAADGYRDGVWVVELAPLTDTQLVPLAVASVLGVREEAGRPVLEALLKFVAGRRMLLVLDSCEHLLEACAALARTLLQTAPDLKLLVTSREPLHLAGEAIYPIATLALPAAASSITLQALSEFESVRLFLDRALTAQPSFELTHQNAAAVAAVCRHVDGIPLAIELAAARARVLPVEKIAERLGERFRLLTHGDPSALPHRQSLRATIDWSHDLLTEPERALLRRFAIFAGGFTLEAAETVGAGGSVEAIDVLDLLTDLVDKSMVVVEAGAERYRLLDTVREYAHERLDESNDGDRARAQHLAFFLAFAERARQRLYGDEQAAWFARLDHERENVLVAHSSCDLSTEGSELGLRLASAMLLYWIHRGGVELGYRETVRALARANAHVPSVARCGALYAAARLASCMGRYATAQTHGEECLSVARTIGDDASVAKALRIVGEQLFAQRRMPEARRHLEEGVAMTRRLDQKLPLSQALFELADLYRLEGNLDAAEVLYEESLTLAREVGDLRNVFVDLVDLASVSVVRGSGERARRMLREALAIVEATGSKMLGAYLLFISAGLAAFVGEWRRAAQIHGASLAQFEQHGMHPEPADEAFLDPLVGQARMALGTEAFAAGQAAGRLLAYDAALAELRGWLQCDSVTPSEMAEIVQDRGGATATGL